MKKPKTKALPEVLYYVAHYASPIGTIEIKGDDKGIASILFLDKVLPTSAHIHPTLQPCVAQLIEYFTSNRKTFDLKLNTKGTDYQERVWHTLKNVSFGKTATYLEISKRMLDANANRAVGNAIGKNPISIIIPCHRIIGSDGKLVGYSGSLWRKEWLLHHETGNIYGKQSSLF